jgi:hypothetical protein
MNAAGVEDCVLLSLGCHSKQGSDECHLTSDVSFLKKEIKEKSYRDKVRQKQQREYTLVELVLEARKRLQVLGIPFSGRALAQQTGVSYDTLQRYPRVRELLQQFRQECSQTKQR